MLHLSRKSLKQDKAAWEKADIKLYSYDDTQVEEATQQTPQWVHFGGGNIFRAFIAALQQQLLNKGAAKTGSSRQKLMTKKSLKKYIDPLII